MGILGGGRKKIVDKGKINRKSNNITEYTCVTRFWNLSTKRAIFCYEFLHVRFPMCKREQLCRKMLIENVNFAKHWKVLNDGTKGFLISFFLY